MTVVLLKTDDLCILFYVGLCVYIMNLIITFTKLMHIITKKHWVLVGEAFVRVQMEAIIAALVEEERKRFPDGVPWTFSYGTAGFREKYVGLSV